MKLTHQELPDVIREAYSENEIHKAIKVRSALIVVYRKDYLRDHWRKHGDTWQMEGTKCVLEATEDPDNT